MRYRHKDEHQESSWISMVDLLTVITLVAVVAAAVALDTAHSKGTQGEDLQSKLKGVESERDIWKVRHQTLQEECSELRQQYLALKKAYEDLKGACSTDVLECLQQLQEVQLTVTTLEQQMRRLESDLADAHAERERLRQEIVRLNAELVKCREGQPSPCAGIAEELLGLEGPFGRTVFVVDTSDTMKETGRWGATRSAVRAIIEHLDVEHAALITFGSDVNVIPASLYDVPNQEPNRRPLVAMDSESRRLMLEELDRIVPSGLTRTEAALARAMEFKDLDAIILFTDGMPETVERTVESPSERARILVRRYKERYPNAKVKVHTVGVGNYFEGHLGAFLRGLAEDGGGQFIGR